MILYRSDHQDMLAICDTVLFCSPSALQYSTVQYCTWAFTKPNLKRQRVIQEQCRVQYCTPPLLRKAWTSAGGNGRLNSLRCVALRCVALLFLRRGEAPASTRDERRRRGDFHSETATDRATGNNHQGSRLR